MRKFWKATLTHRIVGVLGCAMTVFWMLFELIGFYYRFQVEQNTIVDNLISELRSIARHESMRYSEAEKKSQMLFRVWRVLHKRIDKKPLRALTDTVFVAFPNAGMNQFDVQRARDIVEIFGNIDPHRNAVIFLLIPEQGVVFFYPPGLSEKAESDLTPIMRAIAPLAQLRGTTVLEGTMWSAPFKDINGKNNLVVMTMHADTGIMTGQAIRMDTLMETAARGKKTYALRSVI